MLHSIRKYTPLLNRIFIFLLVFVFLFVWVNRPIQVSAFDPATLIVGAAGASIEVLAPVAIIIVILIGVGYANDNIDVLRSKAQSLYDSASTSLRAWYDNVAAQVIDGTSAFKINNETREEIDRQLKQDGRKLPDLRYLLIPATLGFLDGLAQEDVFTNDLIAAVEAGNKIAQQNLNLLEQVKVSLSTLHVKVGDFYTQFTEYRKGVGNLLNAINSNTYTELRNIHLLINNNVLGWFDTINKNLHDDMYMIHNDLKLNISKEVDKLNAVQQELLDPLNEIRTDFSTFVETNYETLVNTDFETLIKTDLVTSINTNFDSLKGDVNNLVEPITEYYNNALSVEVPEIDVAVGTEVITVRDYKSLGNAFSAKMNWVPQIFDFLRELRSRLNPGSAPKLVVSFAGAGGSVNWKNTSATVFDLSWYEPFKPYFDKLISGCLWLCFGWAIYKRIPDILSGVGLTVENATQPQGHVSSERTERRSRYRKGG